MDTINMKTPWDEITHRTSMDNMICLVPFESLTAEEEEEVEIALAVNQ